MSQQVPVAGRPDGQWVLVLDDSHLIDCPAVLAVVGFLLADLPDGIAADRKCENCCPTADFS